MSGVGGAINPIPDLTVCWVRDFLCPIAGDITGLLEKRGHPAQQPDARVGAGKGDHRKSSGLFRGQENWSSSSVLW